MNFRIRPARESDATILCEAEQHWASRGGYLVSQPDELAPESFSKKIRDLSHHPRALYVVIEDEHQNPMGHAMLEPHSLQALAHIVRLTIVIHPAHEGQGLGPPLLAHLVNWAKAHREIEKIELLVRSTNTRAIQLYHSLGFREEGRILKRIKVADQYLDDVAMGLFVKSSAQLE